uniref:subtype A tannase n=1 Tax=uncultured Allisonella sp. TaxID=339338 RepID=UPI00258EB640|nr:subtype A tannase [uncultured Allisonella sp.]
MVNRKKAALSLALMAAVALTGSLSVYASEANAQGNPPVVTAVAQIPEASSSLHVDNTKWNYDETNDIYYQIGLVYCAKPQATEYESLAVYVPGAYMQGVKNPDGTYTCQINPKAKVGNYTTVTAPVVMPVNTGGYAAQKAPSSYDGTGLSTYLSQGFVYVYAGCRGRNNGTNPDGTAYDSGAPWGVTDLKAAVRYLRCNDSLIPGNKNRIFTFGHSGGGAQSALMGATGDSEMYMPYLSSIGALMKDSQGKPLSDAIDGAMCWCPITNLTQADLSYEWMMGQFSSEGTRAYGTWTRSLSRDMARAYADSLNRMGLRDEQGNVLTLTQSESGIYMAGPYYDYLKTTIETSLNNFLKDNQFPLTTGQSDFQVDGAFPGQGAQESMGGWTPPKGAPVMPMAQEEPHTYNSAKEYIDALNGDNPWITYDEKTNTATISSVEAFVEHMKQATKSVGAFDDLQKAQAENLLFGNGQNDALHFDGNMTYFMEKRQNTYKNYSDYDDSIRQAYEGDMNNVDALHVDTLTRQLMYDPMTFILVPAGEKKPSTLAKHWRIHTGISQGDTALTTEVNLALALKQRKDVEDVDFAMVWEKKHTMAERTGSSTENFIQWVKDSVASEK